MAKKKGEEPPESSYTLDPRQETMFDLPTKAPEKVPVAQVFTPAFLQANYEIMRRTGQVLSKYKPKPVPRGQMAFGRTAAFIDAGDQYDIFEHRPEPCACKREGSEDGSAPSTRRRRKEK